MRLDRDPGRADSSLHPESCIAGEDGQSVWVCVCVCACIWGMGQILGTFLIFLSWLVGCQSPHDYHKKCQKRLGHSRGAVIHLQRLLQSGTAGISNKPSSRRYFGLVHLVQTRLYVFFLPLTLDDCHNWEVPTLYKSCIQTLGRPLSSPLCPFWNPPAERGCGAEWKPRVFAFCSPQVFHSSSWTSVLNNLLRHFSAFCKQSRMWNSASIVSLFPHSFDSRLADSLYLWGTMTRGWN